jgi:hypothetical protein
MKNNIFISAKAIVLLLFVSLAVAACSQKYYYAKGLEEARNPTPASVHNGLWTITPSNKNLVWTTIDGKPYVLTVTWKADSTYYTRKKRDGDSVALYSYNTGNYPIWVTLVPQMKGMHLGGLSDKKLNRRLNQLLGLPPVADYHYFLEIWVSPDDLVRPCFDPSTGANVCEFTPSKADAGRSDHICWLYQYIYGSYSDPDMMKRYPFTHLGYTYDWNPKNRSHVGLSEFVIGTNRNIFIRKVYTTRGYIQ